MRFSIKALKNKEIIKIKKCKINNKKLTYSKNKKKFKNVII